MKLFLRHNTALVFALLVACVIGCKSTSSSTSKTSETSTSTKTTSSTTSTTKTAPPDIAGKYSVTGTNPNGSAYKGELEVIKHGDVYQFRWSGGATYDGVGVQLGDVIAVAFTTGENGKGCGVVDYTIADDGATLDGKWGYWGTDEGGTEKAKRSASAARAAALCRTKLNPTERWTECGAATGARKPGRRKRPSSRNQPRKNTD